MKLLAVESSAKSASAAIWYDGKIVAENFINTGFTHSQTLMPMVASTLERSRTEIGEIDAFAVTNGPGSFTGVRIGVAAVKGMTLAVQKPCIGVSTLECIAGNFDIPGLGGTVCAVMDARCGQVYNSLFKIEGNELKRLCEDRAIALEELRAELSTMSGPMFIAGDGAELCYETCKNIQNVYLAPPHLRYQKASAVAIKAAGKLNDLVSGQDLGINYLRPSQAERELKSRG